MTKSRNGARIVAILSEIDALEDLADRLDRAAASEDLEALRKALADAEALIAAAEETPLQPLTPEQRARLVRVAQQRPS